MTPKDWTLIVIAAAPNAPLQPVQLQKCLFLMGQRLSRKQLQVEEFYTFEAYDYGPFCSQIYFDAEMLRDEGLVHIDQPQYLSYRLYAPTDAGKSRANELKAKLDRDVCDFVERLVAWATS